MPTVQVPAVADLHTFIYIVEENEQYSYLAFGQQTWQTMRHFIEQQMHPIVTMGDMSVELTNFV